MTFLQKYLITPVLGTAGLVIGYAIYQRKMEMLGVPASEGTAEEIRRLAAKVDLLATRVSAVEGKTSEGEWLEMIGSRFSAMEERLTVQNERIHGIEQNYVRIERDLDAILRALHKPAFQVVEPTSNSQHEPALGEHAMSAA